MSEVNGNADIKPSKFTLHNLISPSGTHLAYHLLRKPKGNHTCINGHHIQSSNSVSNGGNGESRSSTKEEAPEEQSIDSTSSIQKVDTYS